MRKATKKIMKKAWKKTMTKTIIAALCIAVMGAMLPWMKTTAKAAGEPGQFRSRGVICYQDAAGQRVVLDSGDFGRLFRYAAEGKTGLSGALSGVGTKLIREDTGYSYTRDPKAEASIAAIRTEDEMQSIDYEMLLQALSDSQTLPAGYEEAYVLADSDNLTLGRAAWSDGSLLRGNSRDLTEHYIRGWMEGSGCTDYEAIYDEEGRWIGYRAKQT